MALEVAPPVAKPLQFTLESKDVEANRVGGSEMVTEAESVHPLASVMVTEYVAATTPVMEAVVAPLDQE